MIRVVKDLYGMATEVTTWNLDQFGFEHNSIVTVFEDFI